MRPEEITKILETYADTPITPIKRASIEESIDKYSLNSFYKISGIFFDLKTLKRQNQVYGYIATKASFLPSQFRYSTVRGGTHDLVAKEMVLGIGTKLYRWDTDDKIKSVYQKTSFPGMFFSPRPSLPETLGITPTEGGMEKHLCLYEVQEEMTAVHTTAGPVITSWSDNVQLVRGGSDQLITAHSTRVKLIEVYDTESANKLCKANSSSPRAKEGESPESIPKIQHHEESSDDIRKACSISHRLLVESNYTDCIQLNTYFLQQELKPLWRIQLLLNQAQALMGVDSFAEAKTVFQEILGLISEISKDAADSFTTKVYNFCQAYADLLADPVHLMEKYRIAKADKPQKAPSGFKKLREAVDLYLEGHTSEAEKPLLELTRSDNESLRKISQIYLALSYFAQEKYKDVIELIQAYTEANPKEDTLRDDLLDPLLAIIVAKSSYYEEYKKGHEADINKIAMNLELLFQVTQDLSKEGKEPLLQQIISLLGTPSKLGERLSLKALNPNYDSIIKLYGANLPIYYPLIGAYFSQPGQSKGYQPLAALYGKLAEPALVDLVQETQATMHAGDEVCLNLPYLQYLPDKSFDFIVQLITEDLCEHGRAERAGRVINLNFDRAWDSTDKQFKGNASNRLQRVFESMKKLKEAGFTTGHLNLIHCLNDTKEMADILAEGIRNTPCSELTLDLYEFKLPEIRLIAEGIENSTVTIVNMRLLKAKNYLLPGVSAKEMPKNLPVNEETINQYLAPQAIVALKYLAKGLERKKVDFYTPAKIEVASDFVSRVLQEFYKETTEKKVSVESSALVRQSLFQPGISKGDEREQSQPNPNDRANGVP